MTLHELYKKIGPVHIIPHGDNFEIHLECIKDGERRQIIVESYNDAIIVYYKGNNNSCFTELIHVPYEETRKEYIVCELVYTYYNRIRKEVVV